MKRNIPDTAAIALAAAAAIYGEYRRHSRQERPWDRPAARQRPPARVKPRARDQGTRTPLQLHLAAQPGPKGLTPDSAEYHIARMTSWQHSQWCRRSKRKRSEAKKWADTPRRGRGHGNYW